MRSTTHILFTVFRTSIAIGLLVYLAVSGAVSWPALQEPATFWGVTLAALATLLITVHAYRHNWTTLVAAVGISLLAHTMTIGGTLLAAQATHPSGLLWQMSLLIPLGFLANTLPVTPGGLGVGEAAFDKLFSMAGLTGGAEALLGWRVLMIVIGLLGLIFYLQGRKRLVHALFPSQAILQG